jgi:HPt (histidine-containing phosphotransfer) domain-containing protein
MPGDREACLQAGMDDYIAKPVKGWELQESLKRLGWEVDGGAEGQAVEAAGPGDDDSLASLPGLDLGVIADIHRMRPSMVAELVDNFLTTANHRVAAVRKAVERADDQALRKAAHSLKGSSGTLGAVLMSEICTDLEARGRLKSLAKAIAASGIEAEAIRLEEELERVREAFHRQLAMWSDEDGGEDGRDAAGEEDGGTAGESGGGRRDR